MINNEMSQNPLMDRETDLISIRVGAGIKRSLKKESQMRDMTVNKLVNQILTEYVRFDMSYRKMDVISIPKSFYKAMIAEVGVERIKELARTEGVSAMRSFLLLTHTNITLDAVFENMMLWLAANAISYNYERGERRRLISIQHNLGRNFSELLYTATSSMMEEAGHRAHLRHMDDCNLSVMVDDSPSSTR